MQDLGQHLDDLVADRVAEVVVDRLEVIEVDHDARQRRFVGARGFESNSKLLGESSPVKTTGQGIASREIGQLLVLLLDLRLRLLQAPDHGLQLGIARGEFGDIVERDQDTLRPAVLALNRRRVDREFDRLPAGRYQVELRADRRLAALQDFEPRQPAPGFVA